MQRPSSLLVHRHGPSSGKGIALGGHFPRSAAVRLAAGLINLLSAAQAQAYKGQNQTNQNRILKTYSPNLLHKTKALPGLPTKTGHSRTPEWGRKISTKTSRAARGRPPQCGKVNVLHPSLCGSIPWSTALTWAIAGDTDCWFWSHFHRRRPCCGRGHSTNTYPAGLGLAPLAEHHYAEYFNPLVFTPTMRQLRKQSPAATANQVQAYISNPLARQFPSQHSVEKVNCIGHWMRHCLVLHLVLLLLLGCEGVHGIHALANRSMVLPLLHTSSFKKQPSRKVDCRKHPLNAHFLMTPCDQDP